MTDENFEQANTEQTPSPPHDTPPIPLPAVTPPPYGTGMTPVTPPQGSSYALGALSGNPRLAPPAGPSYPPPPTQGGYAGWPPPPASEPQPIKSHRGRNSAMAAAAAAVLLVAGVGIGHAAWTNSPSTTSAAPPTHTSTGSGSGSGSGSSGGSSGSGSSSSKGSGPADASSIASKVDPGLVDIDTTLGYQGEEAAGTGIVLTSNGEILTNNHVIDGATSISVTDVGNHKTYSASVVGYDRTRDIAVLQLHNASGLQTASIGNSSNVSTGEDVVGIGNAGGTGGTPSYAGGTVTGLDQSITASDEGDDTSEQLTGLIATNADIQAGDSGGSLVTSSGTVIGIDTAASAGFSFNSGSSSSTQGFAIPINTAISLAKAIENGNSSSTVHIGETAFLGIQIDPSTSSGSGGGGFGGEGGFGGGTFGGSGSSVSGVVIAGTVTSSPAQEAGLAEGDTITSVNGNSVTTANGLTEDLTAYHPGDKVTIGWTDSSGDTHQATVTLTSGPPQ